MLEAMKKMSKEARRRERRERTTVPSSRLDEETTAEWQRKYERGSDLKVFFKEQEWFLTGMHERFNPETGRMAWIFELVR